MRKKVSLLLLCLACLGTIQAQSNITIESLKADGNYIVEDSLLVQARDGAFISAMMVRKKNVTDPLPAILQFTIYARQTDVRKLKIAADKGYVGIMAYTRGKRYSEGEVAPYENDGRDCYDVIGWISKQSWCNGKVGMMGGSYNGFAQWASAKKLHPALKTIVPSASAAPGIDVPMMNNVFMTFPFSWTYYVSNNKFLDEEDYRSNKWHQLQLKWFELGTAYPTLDSIIGKPHNKMFRNWLSHPTYDNYWQKMIPYKDEFAQINIPVLTTTGYWDGGQVGALYYMREHLKYNPAANHYLIIGPYGHFGSQGFPDSVYNGYTLDAAARIPIHEIIYQWFDHILKGAARPAFLKDKINYQLMGSNEWKHAAALNKVANDSMTLYLDNKPKELLNSQRPAKKGFSPLTIDFADRTTRNVYYFMNNVMYDSLFDGGGLMFTSEPLKAETEISGNFTGNFKVTINKKDMDYSVALFEQFPDGKYFFLSYFMGRASYTGSNTQRKLLVPGKKTNLPFFNTYFTSKKIQKGSRIMIIVNVNKSPFEQINYGTGKDVNEETIKDATKPLQVKWHNDSYIKLPVMR